MWEMGNFYKGEFMIDQQTDGSKKTNAADEWRIEERKRMERREKWYKAELRGKYVDNDNVATILRSIAESIESLCENLTPLTGWQVDSVHTEEFPRVVGSNGPTKVELIDSQVLENVFVLAYLPAGVVVAHWEFSDDNKSNRQTGNEFIPYHRIKSIFEGASSYTHEA